jgi:hypothetical protein
MATIKISNLPSAGALTGTEVLPIVQSNVTSQTTVQDIADLAGGGAAFPYTGSAGITGSLEVIGSVENGLSNVAGGQFESYVISGYTVGVGVTIDGNYTSSLTPGTIVAGWLNSGDLYPTFAIVTGSNLLGGNTFITSSILGISLSLPKQLTNLNVTNNIGTLTHAQGIATQAIGPYSHTEGTLTITSGSYSHAEGLATTTIGVGSHAEGQGTTAVGVYSHAEGSLTTAIGGYSHSEGIATQAIGLQSHAEGITTTALGGSSHTEGSTTTAVGNASHAEGNATTAVGDSSHAEGSFTIAVGNIAHAEGQQTTAIGVGSHAEGQQTTAVGDYSHAEGKSSKAVGTNSHAEGTGTTAAGTNSHAEGFLTKAIGGYSHTEGLGTVANQSYMQAIGQYNVTGSDQHYAYFVVGNGTADASRSNAFRVSGSGQCLAGGTFTNGGADYAEYFESFDGNAISLGTVVELTGSFIKPCTVAENAIGVISNKPSVLGNSDEGTSDEWIGKYKKDIWGNYEMVEEEYQEEVGFDEEQNPIYETKTKMVRVLNPNYDPTITYIPRAERPEWNVVGLVGQIRVLNNQPIPSRWIKMKSVNSEVDLYFVK